MSQEAAVPAPAEVARGTPWADRLAAFGDRLSDRLNPLVVREVRQGLRTRVFWVTFILLLSTCIITSLVAYVDARTTELSSAPNGRMYFYAYFFGLGVVQFLVLPYTAYRSLAREREDETWVLLTLTGLGPRRILRGKLASSLVQALLYGSAILPFMLLSYYLNGLELPSILLTIALAVLFQLLLTVLAVSAGTLAENRVFRAVVNLAVLGGLMMATSSGLTFAFALAKEGVEMLTHDKDNLAVLGVCLWLLASSGLLLFEVAAARLSLYTENYAKGPRLALLVQVVGSLAVWILAWSFKRDAEVAAAMQLVFCVYLGAVGIFMAGDVDGQARCHRAVRGPWRAFTPGALRGYRFILALVMLSTLVADVMLSFSTKLPHRGGRGLFAATLLTPAYTLIYLSLPVVLGRSFNLPMLGSPVAVRLLTVLLVLVGSGLPPLMGGIFAKADDVWINAFNPVMGTLHLWEHDVGQDEMAILWMNVLVGILLALLADRALARRDKEVMGAP